MRFLRACRNFLCTAVAAAFASCTGLCVRFGGACRLAEIEGERTFYLYSASSQAVQKRELSFFEAADIRGESVCFLRTDGGDGEALARSIARIYDGELLFTEEACGVTSYYFYAEALGGGAIVYGGKVNLHVAVGETYCTVGTPFIFGGF